MKSSIFWDITPCSPLRVNEPFGGTCRLHLQNQRISQPRNQNKDLLATWFTVVSFLTYSSTLKMEATCSFEMPVDFQRTTRRYIPEDITLHNHRCKNLTSYMLLHIKQKLYIYIYSYMCVNYLTCDSKLYCNRALHENNKAYLISAQRTPLFNLLYA
jgi:hypothetical protein